MKYSAEQLSLAGDKYLGRPYSEMDCQKFVEKCMDDVGYHKDLAGSNAWYRACDWTGTPEECIREFGCIPKGALLFILKNDGGERKRGYYDGLGNASHIGIYTGRGDGAIHSSQTKECVTKSVFKGKTIPNGGWNRVGLLKDFDYGTSVNWILDHDGSDNEMTEGIVNAANGKPVNFRKSPSKSGALIDKVPCGTPVEIIADEGEWSKISVDGKEGWMMSMFIQKGAEEKGEYTVTIPNLTESEADELLARYPGASKEQERG